MSTRSWRIVVMLMLAALLVVTIFQPALVGGVACAASVGLPVSQPSGPTDPRDFEAFLDTYLAEQMKADHIPGVVFTMVKDGQVFFSKGYGYADLETQTPFDPEKTVLTTASLAKAFTAIGVLQLYEQGIVDLDADIRPYLTDFQLDTSFPDPLTFANLLTHTDGFQTRLIGVLGRSEDDLPPLGELLEAYMPTQIYPPGKYMTYSDFAANMAGYLTAKLSGTTFEQYMADNVFAPLGMADSTLDVHLSEALRARLAPGYEFQDGQYERMPFFHIRYGPSGGLRTTAADVNRFMLALLGGGEVQGARILEQATTQLMFTQQFAPHPKMGGISYGFFEHLENGQQVFLRDGDGIGTRSRMVLIPDQDLGFFISYNSGDSNLRLEFISAFLDHYYPIAGSSVPVPMAGYQEHTRRFAGTYRILHADTTTSAKSVFFFAQLIEVRASAEGYLIVEPISGGDSFGGFEGPSAWVEVEPLYFERVDGKGRLAFVQDEGDTITHMVSGQGYHGTFSKLPWYETQSFHTVLIALVAFLLISMVVFAFVIWPLGALIRRLGKKPVQNRASWGAVVARLWAGTVSGMLVMFTFVAIGVLYTVGATSGMPNFVWGVSRDIVGALNRLYVPAILVLALPVFTALAWIRGWWKISARVHYALVTLAVFAGIWWAHYWNLLGFRM
jgi:CubicO group peptidase (beta-lactamase class C family)